MNEFQIIERYFMRQRVRRGDVRVGIGDDAAVLRPPPGRELAVTTDVLVKGVHFPEDVAPAALGHKALAVNLSDLAAVGAAPAWATLALTLETVDAAWLEALCGGFFKLAEAFDVALVGGDTTRGPLSIAVGLTGVLDPAGGLMRGGARVGDRVYVSGTLGDAALGLRAVQGQLTAGPSDQAFFLERLHAPTPRVALGRALVGLASAAIDVSDGLAADLGHLCTASSVGARIDIASLPLSAAYQRCLGAVGREPALTFGDDYELCFTVPPERDAEVARLAARLALPLACIGTIVPGDIQWLYNDQAFAVHDPGYRHFR